MIGDARTRVDGPGKATGRIAYTADRRDAGEPLQGVILGAAIGKGRIASIDPGAAERAPGVRLVLTHHNAPPQGRPPAKVDLFDAHPQLAGDRIEFFGQPVALVVADSFEQARAAAQMIDVSYAPDDGRFALATSEARTGWRDVSRFGDIDAAMAAGPVTIESEYTTPYHFSQPMEPNAAIADFRDGHLTVYLTAQILAELRDGLADTLKLDRSRVTIDSAYIGGGFGSKIGLHAEAVLASLASMALNRPVRVPMTRRQMFGIVGHRPASWSRVRLAASPDGRLTAIGHDAHIQVTDTEKWNEGVAMVSRSLYAAPNRLTRQVQVSLDVGAGEPVRGPGELPGLMVLETAMDELAEKLDIDPVELRLRNDTQIDPEKNVPLSGRRLNECLIEGAQRFGWENRPRRPASRRDGEWLVGYGVAASIRGHFMNTSEARVRIEPEGRVLVQTDMTDPGTGTYTIVAQIAAAALGVPFEQVRVELARTDLPRGWGSGGSWGAGNTGAATDRACQKLRQQIEAAAGPRYNDIFAEVRRHFPKGIEATGNTVSGDDDPNYKNFSLFTYGASFAEVAVNAYTAEVRLKRMLGVFSAGRIINPRTARSQLIGGMIWGVSAALHEGAYVDPRNGAWVNGDLAEYLLPVHADLPDIEAFMLDDFDEHANELGVKGIGELGAGGTGGSVANAVYNATGVRVRDFPITIDKLLPGMPAP